MASGIYKLTFYNGDTYVGKSVDVVQRWKQHFDKLSKGTAAKNMVAAYILSDHRYPKTELLLECHPDVLDEYENFFINSEQPTLNTQRPAPRSEMEQGALVRHANEGRALYSTPVIIITLENMADDNARLYNEIEEIKGELENLKDDYEELDAAWNDRALQELRREEKFRELEIKEEKLLVEFNRLWRFRETVESLNWYQRLFKLW